MAILTHASPGCTVCRSMQVNVEDAGHFEAQPMEAKAIMMAIDFIH
jgi:hypothetical protein